MHDSSLSNYKITHFTGKPHGPLSFCSPAGSAADTPSLLSVVAFVPLLALVSSFAGFDPAAAVGFSSFDEGEAAAAVVAAPPEGPSSHAKLTLATAL